jgi:pentatricopeptide repeat protein
MTFDSQIQPNMTTYNNLLEVFAQCNPAQTEDVFQFLCQDRIKFDNFKPNVDTFRSRIEAHVRNNQVDIARDLLLEMRNQGITPNLSVHNTLFWGMYKNNWEDWLNDLASRRDEKKSFFQEYSERKRREAAFKMRANDMNTEQTTF